MNDNKLVPLTGVEGSAPAIADPQSVVLAAKAQAEAVMDVVESKKLYQPIRDKKFLQVEAWELIGAFNGTVARIESVERVEIEGVTGYKAVAVLIDREGREVGRAEALCMRDEPNWRSKPEFQLMSMAQTRAVSKVHRLRYSYIAVLAGYEPTPAEEVEELQAQPAPQPKPQPANGDRDKLMRKMFAVAREQGLLDNEYYKLAFAEHLRDYFDVKSRKDMTVEQLREAIELLQTEEVVKVIKGEGLEKRIEAEGLEYEAVSAEIERRLGKKIVQLSAEELDEVMEKLGEWMKEGGKNASQES